MPAAPQPVDGRRRGRDVSEGREVPPQKDVLEREEAGGGGLRPNTLCTKNGPTRCSRLQISFFPTLITLVWRGGGEVQGGTPPPFSYSVRPF